MATTIPALRAASMQGMAPSSSETRLVQVGESAAPAIELPAAALRSTALSITGTAGLPPMEVLSAALAQVLDHASRGHLRMETEEVPLSRLETSWNLPAARRLVFRP